MRFRFDPTARLLLLWIVVGLTAGHASGQPLQRVALARVDSTIQAAVDQEVIPGAVVLIAKDGRTFHKKAFGFAQKAEFGGRRMDPPLPMTTGHVFDLASLTKVFATTFGIMLLVDRGLVDLDAPVATYLPACRGGSKDSVTVRHLLSHTGGLAPWKPVYFHARAAREAAAYISGLPLSYPVGTQRVYSDLGFMLLGYLIEAVGGRPLDRFLEEELYEPLELRSTTFNPRSTGQTTFAATSHGNPYEYKMVDDDAFGYRCDENVEDFTDWRRYMLLGEVNDGNAFYAHGGVAGHAGLFSTASDLQVLLELLIGKGTIDGRRFIGEEVVERFLTADAFGNGLGWAMAPQVLGLRSIPEGGFGHTGFTGTYALAVPSAGLSLILLTNRQNGGVLEDGTYPNVTQVRRAVVEIVLEAVGLSK